MTVNTYVAVSAQRAMEARLESIASNIANVNTPGFRAAGVRFEAEIRRVGQDQVAYASSGESYVNRKQGPITYTGNTLDVAIQGDGWFGFNTPQGTVYSRDGRFHMNANGDLLSAAGYAVTDPGGSPIVLDPAGGPVQIGENGTISQAGQQLGSIGLFTIPADAKLRRHDNSAIVPDKPAEPVEDMTADGMRQGYLEGSNVNPVVEMTRLIEASRAFDQATAAANQDDETIQEAIRTLGAG